ncbi:hypothetical protein V502_00833 [Pseudogymnoascus sp. VKM F-4520 (FW-2644)]|nr:hypothetical protein V502_00833 [Pseudogymnoascus sp. VKM F-4520 (FW-2644)]
MNAPDEVVKKAARFQEQILARLRNDLKNNRLAIITGAGVTLNVTADTSRNPLSRITWTDLMRNGLDHLVSEGYVDTSNRRTKRAYDALEDPEVDGLLDAANIVTSQMKQHGQFRTWLESVFGSLSQEIRHPALINVLKELHERGATLLTTNYDDVLEKHCGLQRIGRSNQDDVSRFQRGDLKGVFHLHGSYLDAHEVVLDTTDYYEVKHSGVVQHMLKTFLQDKTILFVGCGSGLEDPNFDALLRWASKRHKNLPRQHYLLIRDDDSVNYQPLLRVKYGPRYEDLVLYLKRLLDDHTEAPSQARPPYLNAPIRDLSAYMFFAKEQRDSVRDENPGITFGQIGKVLGYRWKALNEKQRAPYEAKAALDKKRYKDEKAIYNVNADKPVSVYKHTARSTNKNIAQADSEEEESSET